MLDHWLTASLHGSYEDMLFLDQSSNTVLNVKGKYLVAFKL
jgi:hypothetical protein